MAGDLQKKLLTRKEVSYLNKDFESFKRNLINFAKHYFPTVFTDFSENDPGMMFIDLACYVADSLSFYIDHQFKENLLEYASERSNVLAIASMLGYKPKVSTPAATTLDVYQLVPAIKNENDEFVPNLNYALIINAGMIVSSEKNPSIAFRTLDVINFKINGDASPTEISLYQKNDLGEPEFFLLKKKSRVSAGRIVVETFSFGDPVPYSKITLASNRVIEILSVVDSDGNVWHEVESLAQDLVWESRLNNGEYDEESAVDVGSAPYLLTYKRTSRRFVRKITADNKTELHFGPGMLKDPDEYVIASPHLVNEDNALSNPLDVSLDPTNFLTLKAYGQAPGNTTLTVTYVAGGGVETNVMSNELTRIELIDFLNDPSGLDLDMLNFVKSSFACNNPEPAVGGRGPETTEEIRLNAMANFMAQNRAVTAKDYEIRCLAMPSRYGAINKVFVTKESDLERAKTKRNAMDGKSQIGAGDDGSGSTVSIYVLSIDRNGHLTKTNKTIKKNLATYLSQYKILTDEIKIIDGFIINIGVRFSVLKFPNYNNREVLLNCIKTVKDFFSIEKMQFNQSISISDLMIELQMTDGVRSVIDVEIYNKYERPHYSGCMYDIKLATRNNIIYPSLDPSIFELKYPEKDIEGRIVNS